MEIQHIIIVIIGVYFGDIYAYGQGLSLGMMILKPVSSKYRRLYAIHTE